MALPLSQFLEAVQNDQHEEIRSYLAMLDQASANMCLDEVGTHYGFKTFWEPTAFDGWRVMLGQDLADVMYGMRDVASLKQLLRRYGIELYNFRASVYDTRTLKAHFGLAKSVSQASFATWNHFLIAGMKGETPLARKVGAYLLAREQEARISEMALQRPPTVPEALRQTAAELEKHGEQIQALALFKQDVTNKVATIERGVRGLKHGLRVLKGGIETAQQTGDKALAHSKNEAQERKHGQLRQQREYDTLKTAFDQYKQEAQYRARKHVPQWMFRFISTITQGQCMKCGRQCRYDVPPNHPEYSNIDHIKRPVDGESADVTKLQLLCVEHHKLKTRLEIQGVPYWELDWRPETVRVAAVELVAMRRAQRKQSNRAHENEVIRQLMLGV